MATPGSDAPQGSAGSPRSLDLRISQQYKSFMAWLNHHAKARGSTITITNLEDSLEDGLLLIELLEHLSGYKLAQPVKKPALRVQKLNNLAIAFKQLRREIHLENIAPEDIADRNVKIVMGLVWSLILRYQIASLEGSIKSGGVVDEEQRQTLIEYVGRYLKTENVTVQSFEQSFSDGIAFCALFKLLKPDLVNLPALQKESARVRLKHAFALWEQHYNIPQFLDADELVARPKADERSVMTYVALCLSVLERNRVPCPAAEGKESRGERSKMALSKNKFKFMSSALLPKTRAVESMDLSTSTLSLDKRNSPRDSDSLRNNPLLSPRQLTQSMSSTSLSRSPVPSPRSGRYRVPGLDMRSASSQNVADPRQVQTARTLTPTEITPSFSPAALAKRDAHKLQEELDTQISKLSSIVESNRAAPLKASLSSGNIVPSMSPSISGSNSGISISQPVPASASVPTPAHTPLAQIFVAPTPTAVSGVASPTANEQSESAPQSMSLTDALEQIESVTLSLAPRASLSLQPVSLAISPAPSASTLGASSESIPAPARVATPVIDAANGPPPPVARPIHYVPKDGSGTQRPPASVATTSVSTITATAGPSATAPATLTAATASVQTVATQSSTPASSGTNLQVSAPSSGSNLQATAAKVSSFALVSQTEFSQLVGSATSAVSSAAKTFIGDLRGRSGAADLRQVTSLRPLIVVVVRETGSLLGAMEDGRESRELVAVVKSFIIAGYQLTAALARDTEASALKDSLQTVVCHIKLLLRSLAWLNEA